MSILDNILTKKPTTHNSMNNGEMVTEVINGNVITYLKVNNLIYRLNWEKHEPIKNFNLSSIQSSNFKQNFKGWKLDENGKGEFENLESRNSIKTKKLEYDLSFVDYRFIAHNFTADIATTETYLPWYGVQDNTTMNSVSTGFLAPYKMTLHKLFVRPETLTNTSAELTFALDKQDNGDITVDSVATFTYDTTLASNTLLTVNSSDWSATPSVEAGDKIGLSIDASADPSGSIDWYITSVWKVEVQI